LTKDKLRGSEKKSDENRQNPSSISSSPSSIFLKLDAASDAPSLTLIDDDPQSYDEAEKFFFIFQLKLQCAGTQQSFIIIDLGL
jgi:hypothetical protein